MNEPKIFRAIMLSSTFTDLREHRQKAIEAISKLGYVPNVMEHTGARADADVIESSLNMVRDSVAYVGVISLKYGQTPFDLDRNPDRLSITELEFNEAMQLGRPVLLFIMSDEHPIKKADVESDPDKLKKLTEFRERAKQMRAGGEVHRVYETFESLEQFSTAAAIAVGRLVQHLSNHPTISLPPKSVATRARGISNIPINVPRHFLGRDADLAAIDAALKGSKGRAAISALHGLRGVGKSTLAAAYAEQHHGNYRATWWIRAETEATMRADLVGLGVQLEWVASDSPEEATLAAVLDQLRRDGEDVLLIYDNAISPGALSKFLPRGAGPRIIVTSNAPNWRAVASPVEIEVWPNDIGADFLIARTGRRTERDAALALSEALGGLPLAHEQAAAYCDRVGVMLAEYRKRFEAAPAILLDATLDASREYHDGLTVAKTFALAIDEAAKVHPAAAPLIEYAALLAPEPIPLYLFSEAREEFGEPLASLLKHGGLDEAVAALRAFSLLDRESIPDERDSLIATDCIRLHRLVRQVAAARCKPQERTHAVCILMAALASVYPDNVFSDPKAWPVARRLDAIAFALVGGDAPLPEEAEAAAAYLLGALESYRHKALAANAEAQRLSERALAVTAKIFGPDHPNVAICLINLGLLLREGGDLDGARRLYERALAIDEKVHGADHPEIAIDLNNLAEILFEQLNINDAQAMYERALAITEKQLGLEHPSAANYLSNLGYLFLRGHKDIDRARSCYEQALVIREKALVHDHPDIAISLNNLGQLLRQQGDHKGARLLFERALRIFAMAFGAVHPVTKGCARNTANLLDFLGLKEEATKIRDEHKP